MTRPVLGIIGGSGLYEMAEFKNLRWQTISSPWGEPSDAVCLGQLHGLDMVFLPRHGRGHRLSPSAINYRANIDVLKRMGVTDVISVSACGSLREDYKPQEFVIPTQFIDRTHQRARSFFGAGCVAHVSMAEPVCARLNDMLFAAAKAHAIAIHREAVSLVIEGPQFSSKAESHLYRQWGCDTITMTQMPEARLAREAELPYATLAIVTDYDSWYARAAAVTVDQAVAQLQACVARAQDILKHVAQAFAEFGEARPASAQGIEYVLDSAIVTPPEARDAGRMRKLDAICRRYLQAQTPKSFTH